MDDFELPDKEENKTSKTHVITQEGIGYLCVLLQYLGDDDDDKEKGGRGTNLRDESVRTCIQGYLVMPSAKESIGFMASSSDPPHDQTECCCCVGDDKPFWYHMSLIDYHPIESPRDNPREFHELIKKTGGRFCQFSGRTLYFYYRIFNFRKR